VNNRPTGRGRTDGGPPRAFFAAAVVLSLLALGAALVSQHQFGMQPCAWCVLQRVVFVAIAIVALPGLLIRQRAVRATSAVSVLLFSLAGAGAALWQHLVAASSTSCAMTRADRIVRGAGLDELWPAGFSATASCAEAAVDLFGVPYEFYSLALFTLLAVGALASLLKRRAVR
jgi:disulfide bond formation protein DsbB